MTTSQLKNISIIIIDKNGSLKSLAIKEYNESELYKKCGFKKPDGFIKQCDWTIKIDGKKCNITLFAKAEGKANTENKFDFPPPVDTLLLFGSCIIVKSIKSSDGSWVIESCSIDQWNKIYEKLFGGFEDLSSTAIDDELEEDELLNIPKHKKTKQGYLKDGFVVDSSGSDEEEYVSECDDEDTSEKIDDNDTDDIIIEDIGSELSEEDYETDDDETN